MIFRASGKLTNGTPFSSRLNAEHSIGAFVAARKLLADNSVPDEQVAEISVRPLQGKQSVHFGKAKTQAEIDAAKAKRAEKKNAAAPVATGAHKRK